MAQREGREVEGGGPALGPLHNERRLLVVDWGAGGPQERGAFRRRHPQVVGRELEQAPACAQAGEIQRWPGTAAENERAAHPDAFAERTQNVETLAAAHVVHVVEDQHDRVTHRSERGHHARQGRPRQCSVRRARLG